MGAETDTIKLTVTELDKQKCNPKKDPVVIEPLLSFGFSFCFTFWCFFLGCFTFWCFSFSFLSCFTLWCFSFSFLSCRFFLSCFTLWCFSFSFLLGCHQELLSLKISGKVSAPKYFKYFILYTINVKSILIQKGFQRFGGVSAECRCRPACVNMKTTRQRETFASTG